MGCDGCNTPIPEPDPDDRLLNVYGEPGAPLAITSEADLEYFERGRAIMEKRFKPSEGLGPEFNAESCTSCHQRPVAGGSGPRYRNFYLARFQTTNGQIDAFDSIVFPLYKRRLIGLGENETHPLLATSTEMDQNAGQLPRNVDIVAQRNAPPMFGTGLLEAIPDQHILDYADPDDANGDGISGRANILANDRVGRLGYKSQAANLEDFNRGAFKNQMGITTNPIEEDRRFDFTTLVKLDRLTEKLIPSAFAQAGAGTLPTTDRDHVLDPEVSDEDLIALNMFNRFLAVPSPRQVGAKLDIEVGEEKFKEIGCTSCHREEICTANNCFRPYSDLLIHNMGDGLADGIEMGEAAGDEFRTQPLWGLSWTAPYLHHGAADTIHDAIVMHGGEAVMSKVAYEALTAEEQQHVITFLESL